MQLDASSEACVHDIARRSLRNRKAIFGERQLPVREAVPHCHRQLPGSNVVVRRHELTSKHDGYRRLTWSRMDDSRTKSADQHRCQQGCREWRWLSRRYRWPESRASRIEFASYQVKQSVMISSRDNCLFYDRGEIQCDHHCDDGKHFEPGWPQCFGVEASDCSNDSWIDLAGVGLRIKQCILKYVPYQTERGSCFGYWDQHQVTSSTI